MNNDFSAWLDQNGLTKAFRTQAGDTLYKNIDKMFGVLVKAGSFNVKSFYLDDVVGFRVRDDENTLFEWSVFSGWRNMPRRTHYSTSEIEMIITLRDGTKLKLQIFRAAGEKVRRDSEEHVALCNYASQIAQAVQTLATCRNKANGGER